MAFLCVDRVRERRAAWSMDKARRGVRLGLIESPITKLAVLTCRCPPKAKVTRSNRVGCASLVLFYSAIYAAEANAPVLIVSAKPVTAHEPPVGATNGATREAPPVNFTGHGTALADCAGPALARLRRDRGVERGRGAGGVGAKERRGRPRCLRCGDAGNG